MAAQINNSKNIVTNVTIGSIGGNLHVGDIIIKFSDGTEQAFPMKEIKDRLRQDLWEEVLEKSKGENFFDRIAAALSKPKSHLLLQPALSEKFLHRAKELKELHDILFDDKKDHILLLVNGQGGIGKTSLASHYYHEYKNEYSHLAFVLAQPSIYDALLRLKEPLQVEFPDGISEDKRLDRVLTAMQNLDKPCLLVLDNANEPKDLSKYYQKLRSCPNFHLLLTTRIEHFENAQCYKVKAVEREKAHELFQAYYPEHDTSENDLLLKVYDAVEGNTLVLEVLAKNLRNLNANRRRYGLSDLLTDIKEKGMLNIRTNINMTVQTDWHGWEIQAAKPEEILEAMYDLSNLQDEERALLSVFSVLPPKSIPYETLFEILTPEDEDKFEAVLNSVWSKGWVEKSDSPVSYRISPVVQEIVRHKNEVRLFADCKTVILKLDSILENLLYESKISNEIILQLSIFLSNTLHNSNADNMTEFCYLNRSIAILLRNKFDLSGKKFAIRSLEIAELMNNEELLAEIKGATYDFYEKE